MRIKNNKSKITLINQKGRGKEGIKNIEKYSTKNKK